VIALINSVMGWNFRGVDMIILRMLELKFKERNRQKLAGGTVKMKEIISGAASRLMI
jgi:hypothetical protein